jgi:hypothetical protein
MAVIQAETDAVASAKVAEGPEARLLRLEEEVDLLKTSIKRLLIDIRERMNDMDSPFTAAPGREMQGAGQESTKNSFSSSQAGTGIPSGSGGGGNGDGVAAPQKTAGEIPAVPPSQESAPLPSGLQEKDFIQAIRFQMGNMPGAGKSGALSEPESLESKVRLQMVFRLFAWTTKNVRMYGHDRVDLMLESYRAMGYISNESCALVKDIARLMPSTLGEQHAINAEEYVTELYELNHIMNPGDMSLDRDMIEVFMQSRTSGEPEAKTSPLEKATEEIAARDPIRKRDRA